MLFESYANALLVLYNVICRSVEKKLRIEFCVLGLGYELSIMFKSKRVSLVLSFTYSRNSFTALLSGSRTQLSLDVVVLPIRGRGMVGIMRTTRPSPLVLRLLLTQRLRSVWASLSLPPQAQTMPSVLGPTAPYAMLCFLML